MPDGTAVPAPVGLPVGVPEPVPAVGLDGCQLMRLSKGRSTTYASEPESEPEPEPEPEPEAVGFAVALPVPVVVAVADPVFELEGEEMARLFINLGRRIGQILYEHTDSNGFGCNTGGRVGRNGGRSSISRAHLGDVS